MELPEKTKPPNPHYILLSINQPLKEFAVVHDRRIEWLNKLKVFNDKSGFESTLIHTNVGANRSRRQKEMLFDYYLNKGYGVINKIKLGDV